jgi:hypothetical protein
MNENDPVQNRLEAIERKLDEVAKRFPAEGEAKKAPHRGRTARIFWGIFIFALGLIWLGQNFGIEWLGSLKFWPVAVIVFGLYLIFGDRNW